MSQQNPPQARPSLNSAFPSPYASPSPSFMASTHPQSQPPQNKRPSPLPPNTQPTMFPPHLVASSGPPRPSSPMTVTGINGFHPAPSAPGSMGPPSRPAEKAQKATDIRSLEDPLAGTGINLDEEERNLTNSTYYLQQAEPNASFRPQGASLGTGSIGSGFERAGSNGQQSSQEQDSEEARRRVQAEANYRAGSWAQHPLWDAFLLGDPVEKRLNKCAYENGIQSTKEGLFLATKGQSRPQTTQVIGHDGATQIIDRGQTILSTESGEVLGDIMKIVSLATKDRITGLLDHSGRLACERRDHSSGRIPTEWKPVAISPTAPTTGSPSTGGATASKSLKRTLSQTEEEEPPPALPHKIVSVFQKLSNANRDSEKARLAKRIKRNSAKATEAGGSAGPATPSGIQTPPIAPAEPERRLSKKDRKAVQHKMTDALQQKSANETARMATGSLGNNKFMRRYAWLNQNSPTPPGGNLASTPNRPSTPVGSGQSTPVKAPPRPSLTREQCLGDWNEREEGGIQVRDVLLVLETDGKAVKALSKAYNVPDMLGK